MRSSSPRSMNRCLPHDSAPRSTRPSTRAAESVNRPCGLPTRTTRPVKASSRSAARRWRVWPSGIVGVVPEGRVGERWQVTGRLVGRQLADAPYVPLVAAERRAEEDLDEPGHVLHRMHPATDGDDLRVVVLARERRGLLGPREGAPDAGPLVGGHLLTVARAAD